MIKAALQKNLYRRIFSNAVAVLIACPAGYFLNQEYWYWVLLGALLVMPTTRGTPARQSLVILIGVLVAMIVGSMTIEYISHTGWAISNAQVLQNKLLLVTLGGLITITCSLLILPVMPYQEFRHALIVMIDVMIEYSSHLSRSLVTGEATDCVLLNIAYPEWVFEAGFNRNFRSSFRYVLIQMDRLIETFFSLDYYLHQSLDANLREDVGKSMANVVEKNSELLQIMRAFFANQLSENIKENYISDITDLRNVLETTLPDSLELLDVSQDYTIISATARDLMDARELLLQILAGLPIDDVAAVQQ